MSCRLCGSCSTKLTSSINDNVIVEFLNFVPKIVLSEDSSLPTLVCQLCYGKAKISYDFITKAISSQQQLKREKPAKSKYQDNLVAKLKGKREISIKRVESHGYEDLKPQLCETNQEPDLMEDDSSDETFAIEENDVDSDQSFDPLEHTKKEAPLKVNKQKEVYIQTPITFTCAMCKTTFPTFLKLSVHMKQRSCTPSLRYICTVCNKECVTRKKLTSHSKTHKPKHKLMCESCGKEFNSQFDLDFHMEVVHERIVNESGMTYRCSHCPDTFNSHVNLVEHIKQHKKETNESSRLCEICAKECSNLKSYQAHIATHKNKSFVCNVCSKTFMRSVHLIQHMHVHDGIKTFKCDICDRAFAKQDSLRSHKKKEH